MTLLDRDVDWLTAEARSNPDSAQGIIEALIERVQTLQRQTDELRAENAFLKRSGGQQPANLLVHRLETNLRDLRNLAANHGLDVDVITMLSFTGHGIHFHVPAPIEQTIAISTSPDESITNLKPFYLCSTTLLRSLLVVTSKLRLALIPGLSIPVSENYDWRDALPASTLGLTRAERIEAIMCVDDLRPPRDVIMVTRQGWIRVMSWSLMVALSISGQPVTLPGEGDMPVWLGAGEANADVLLVTRNGRWTRFPINMVVPGGCQGITLDIEDDVVVAAVLRRDTHASEPVILFVGADGEIFAVGEKGLESHKKPGAKATVLTRRYMALACFALYGDKHESILLFANPNEFSIVNVKGLPIAAKLSDIKPLRFTSQRLISAALL